MAERDGGADPNTRGGGSNNWKKRLGGEPSSFTARITALRAYVRKIIRPFFLLDIHTLSPHRSRLLVSRRKTMEESFSLSFIVCHGYRMHYWLFILVEERKREGEYSSRSKRSEIEPADQILWQANTWKFCRGAFHPRRFGYFPSDDPHSGILSSNDFNPGHPINPTEVNVSA